MGKILILLFIFFIIIPLFRIGIALYKAQRKATKAFSQFHEEQQRQAQEFQSQQKKEKQRQRRQQMGEYVDFEEVSDVNNNKPTSQQSSTHKKARYKNEPLISDAEWEDIK